MKKFIFTVFLIISTWTPLSVWAGACPTNLPLQLFNQLQSYLSWLDINMTASYHVNCFLLIQFAPCNVEIDPLLRAAILQVNPHCILLTGGRLTQKTGYCALRDVVVSCSP